jgi:hypothetical protein
LSLERMPSEMIKDSNVIVTLTFLIQPEKFVAGARCIIQLVHT